MKAICLIVGAGNFAQNHIRNMLKFPSRTKIVGIVEPGDKSRDLCRKTFSEAKTECPEFYNSINDFLSKNKGSTADTALICSPHKFHFENAKDCLENGMDVCLEKPMVMNAIEAKKLIQIRDKTRKLLAVAFPGSFSPAIQKLKTILAKNEIGKIASVSAFVHQQWKKGTTGTWRQKPEISGGGFLFDTGSHMINTVVDIVGEDITKVSAILDNCGTPVEINSSVSAVSKNGTLISLAGAGDSIQCASEIMLFGDNGIIKTGIWGERLMIKRKNGNDFKPIPFPKSKGLWQKFLDVRSGKIENPCPPEVGLRLAKLMDMIRKSANTGKTISI